MTKEKLNISIVGSGEHSSVVLDCVDLIFPEHHISAFDEDPEKFGNFLEKKYIIKNLININKDDLYHIAIGSNKNREIIFNKYFKKIDGMLTLVHPRSYVSKSSIIQHGSFIAANSLIGPNSSVGYGCIINHNSIVDHDCKIEDWCHIAPGAILGGTVKVARGTLIGAGAVVLKGLEIGENVVVGAGAVVTKNVPDNTIVMGVPARKRFKI